MTAKKIIKKFPEFAKLFDGQAEENTLKFYYKKSKETGVYEFIDLDAEEEVAELMGVKIKTFSFKDEESMEESEKKALDKTDIDNFKTHMADIRTGIMWLNSKTSPDTSSESDSGEESDDKN